MYWVRSLYVKNIKITAGKNLHNFESSYKDPVTKYALTNPMWSIIYTSPSALLQNYTNIIIQKCICWQFKLSTLIINILKMGPHNQFHYILLIKIGSNQPKEHLYKILQLQLYYNLRYGIIFIAPHQKKSFCSSFWDHSSLMHNSEFAPATLILLSRDDSLIILGNHDIKI